MSLGRIGAVLASSLSELLAFIAIIILPLVASIGYTLEKKIYSIYFGINPFGIVAAMLFAFLYIDSYSENFQSKLNKSSLSVFPISSKLKYSLFYFIEVVGFKILFFLFLGITVLVFDYNTPFINLNQLVGLYSIMIVIYLIYSSFITVLKLLWTTKNMMKKYLIIYSILPVVFSLLWGAEFLFTLIERYFWMAMIFYLLIILMANYFFYLIFKKITITDLLFK
tara:strand:- start:6690 stop:7361 length:672 start_codon:yes stop_codon:yes gene_type:complete